VDQSSRKKDVDYIEQAGYRLEKSLEPVSTNEVKGFTDYVWQIEKQGR
jgi:hypothetical protein